MAFNYFATAPYVHEVYVDNRTLNSICGCFQYTKEITEELDEVRVVIKNLLRIQCQLFEKHPELLPANRNKLDRKSLQLGGSLYDAARKYLKVEKRLMALRDWERRMKQARAEYITLERKLRRGIEAQEEDRRRGEQFERQRRASERGR